MECDLLEVQIAFHYHIPEGNKMILFLIKKTFFDFWDNLLTVILLNLGFILIGSLEISSLILFSESGFFSFTGNRILFPYFFSYVIIVIDFVVSFVYMGAVGKFVKGIADYEKPGFTDFFKCLKETFKSSAIFAVISSFFSIILIVSGRYYLIDNPQIGELKIGFLLFILLYLLALITILASQFFFPLQSAINTKVAKNIKKMFLLFFDNAGFSIILFIVNIAVFLLSALTFFLFFGPAVNMLLMAVAFKLRLYKYVYLEKNPGTMNKNIPWEELLASDNKVVGKRNLRNMFFPWK